MQGRVARVTVRLKPDTTTIRDRTYSSYVVSAFRRTVDDVSAFRRTVDDVSAFTRTVEDGCRVVRHASRSGENRTRRLWKVDSSLA